MRLVKLISILLTFLFFIGCGQKKSDLNIDYTQFKLENGLDVVLHQDKSDPIVSVAIMYHVGSNREETGKTGFAHLFEHMLFQESQNVPQDQFFRKIQDAGGTLNGGTWTDGTVYYEVVPKNALEMVLWMESDRMGYLLPTVTQAAFANQQDVVVNEKRQRVDNNPYGHTGNVIRKLMYPEGHPYSWTVIGEMEDLMGATLKDVHNFYKKWYGPNNATLVVAGDIEIEDAKKLVSKYFSDIKKYNEVKDFEPKPVTLTETKKAYHEDNFAKSPELNLVFPTVEQYTKDSYALDMLAELFAGTKKTPLYKTIVEEKKLAPSISVYQGSNELTGEFRIRIRTFPGKNLTEVEKAVFEAFEKFEKDGFSDTELEAIKAQYESNFYGSLSSLLSKSFTLASYNEFAGSPDFLTKDLQNSLDVTKEDILRVYNKYIKGKNYVATSFVPKGQAELVADGSEKFAVVEEIETKQVDKNEAIEEIAVDELPSSFDRSVEPKKGEDPVVTMPDVWETELANGIKLIGIENNELPVINFQVVFQGGMLFDTPEKVGVANLMSDMLMQGTANKTAAELEEAINLTGASVQIFTGDDNITLSVNCLTSKLDQVTKIIDEIVLEPRWDETEFARVKSETIEAINRNMANPNRISANVFRKIMYGKNSILCNNTYGTTESVEAITIDDLKSFYTNYFAPELMVIAVSGDIKQAEAKKAFVNLEAKLVKKNVEFPKVEAPALPKKSKVYFVDYPGAKQSVIRIGHPSVDRADDDYYKYFVMNYKLGGSFNSNVNLILREEKGYTYGARTGFSAGKYPGSFAATSSVMSSATLESTQIFRDEINKYVKGISEDDLSFTKNAILKSNARAFETLPAKLNVAKNIALYDMPKNYLDERQKFINSLTLESHKELANKAIHPDNMIYLIVGDAATQVKELKKLGLGNPIMLDREGNQID